MTARKRGGHFARGRRSQGREARVQKQSAEALEQARRRDAQVRAQMAFTDAERALRAEEKLHRLCAAAEREYAETERRARERRINLLRKEYEDRERELSAFAGVMVTIPKPEPARAIRRKPEDQAVGWGRPRSAPQRSVAELRRLNGLD